MNLRTNINSLYNAVEWNWYRQGGQNVLTWNWSPDYNWAINVHVSGWDEALITYVLAASSNIPSNTIPKIVYDNGWAANGGMKNGKSFYNITLPLGPDYGGPLFFAHYSFLGINPKIFPMPMPIIGTRIPRMPPSIICIVSITQIIFWIQQFVLGAYGE